MRHTGKEVDLAPLLRPRSVAVLGASDRPSPGRMVIESLDCFGFPGPVYPINPNRETLFGRPCYPSIDELPEPVDVLAVGVNHTRVIEQMQAAARRGVRAAIIFDGGFAERGEEGQRRQEELTAICREAGIALCGPNCMGVVNPHARSSIYIQTLRDPARLAGNVGLVSQSGSIMISLLADCRRFGWSQAISSGNEAVLTAVDFLDYLIDDPATRIIALFLESVREPDRFVAALDRAADRGKPVVVLKVGRSERARRAITSHTGGLAGEARVFSAALSAHRAIEVNELDEMVEVLACCQGPRWPEGRRTAVMTASGGLAELPIVRERLVADVAEARAAAATLGYPVVLKVVSDAIPHRSEHGLVAVGLRDEMELVVEWERMSKRLAEMGHRDATGFLVQAMERGGLEVFAGVSADPNWGPVLAFGTGGVLIETLADVALRTLPLREGDAEAMIAGTRAGTLLAGYRGQPPGDVPALARCLNALADFAWAERDHVAEIDVNPIVVRERGRGCVVVDALIVPRLAAGFADNR